MVPRVIVLHALFHGTILSQVFQDYAPVILHHHCLPELQVTVVTGGHNMQTAYTNWSEFS